MAEDTKNTPSAPPSSETRKMVITLSGVAALSGLLIVGAFQFTAPYINANREARTQKAVFTVVPGAARKQAYGVKDDQLIPNPPNAAFGDRFYAVYDESDALKGIALETSGQGYQDIIRILYGYDPARQIVTGMTVLESKETPGLGDKIGKDPSFLANFDGLDVALDETGKKLAHDVVVVKHGKKSNPWEIEGISGATISSKAIGAMMEQGLQRSLPMLQPHLDELRKAAP